MENILFIALIHIWFCESIPALSLNDFSQQPRWIVLMLQDYWKNMEFNAFQRVQLPQCLIEISWLFLST